MNAGLPLGTMPTSGTWYDVYDGCTLLIDGTVNINCYKDGGWTLESSLLDGWSKEDPFAGQETQVIDYLAIGPNGHMYKVVIDPGIFVGDAGGGGLRIESIWRLRAPGNDHIRARGFVSRIHQGYGCGYCGCR